MPVLGARPRDYQRENWLLNPDRYWERVRRFTQDDLSYFADPEEPLWIDGYSSANGLNDRIPLSLTGSLDSSLRLIKVDRLVLSVFLYYSKRRVRGRFRHAHTVYSLRITDPVYEERYQQQEDGDYRIGESYLTVSLGEPFEEYSYKLIAAVIEPNAERSLE